MARHGGGPGTAVRASVRARRTAATFCGIFIFFRSQEHAVCGANRVEACAQVHAGLSARSCAVCASCAPPAGAGGVIEGLQSPRRVALGRDRSSIPAARARDPGTPSRRGTRTLASGRQSGFLPAAYSPDSSRRPVGCQARLEVASRRKTHRAMTRLAFIHHVVVPSGPTIAVLRKLSQQSVGFTVGLQGARPAGTHSQCVRNGSIMTP